MKRRLRKKLRVKEFQIQEWFVGFIFNHELSESEHDEFYDATFEFIDNKKHIYFGGGSNKMMGSFIFFGDPEPKFQVTHEKAQMILQWFIENEFVKDIKLHNITNISEHELDKLFKEYNHFMDYENDEYKKEEE